MIEILLRTPNYLTVYKIVKRFIVLIFNGNKQKNDCELEIAILEHILEMEAIILFLFFFVVVVVVEEKRKKQKLVGYRKVGLFL